MAGSLSFEYSSRHGALAAAYTSGRLAVEFGPERIRVALSADAEQRGWPSPLLAELPIAEAWQRRCDTRLLGVVNDGELALLTSHITLHRQPELLVRALGALLLARPHRPPSLDQALLHHVVSASDQGWVAEQPLRSARILIAEDVPTQTAFAA